LDLDDQLSIAQLHPQFVALTRDQRQLPELGPGRVGFGVTFF
jgi:hypothetical protein